jgi:phospho-N-acetylmuramoyl-pentapeptide-transferase
VLWCDLTSPLVWPALFVTVGYGALGFVDDYLKITKKNKRGVPGKLKLVVQFLVGAVAVGWLFYGGGLDPEIRQRLAVPLLNFEHHRIQIPLFLYALTGLVLVVMGCSNGVNLTDGLDGLAIGPVAINAATYVLFTYVAGNVKLSTYLQIPYVAGAGELAVVCGALVGSGIGFLWFNSYPAEVFMGDVGSLSLGGGLGALAVITKQEILLVIVGGVFVVEALSVIFQVGSYKYRGKRIFRMAPIHHHFELKGVAEPKIIVRFWIITLILALVAISTLKMR